MTLPCKRCTMFKLNYINNMPKAIQACFSFGPYPTLDFSFQGPLRGSCGFSCYLKSACSCPDILISPYKFFPDLDYIPIENFSIIVYSISVCSTCYETAKLYYQGFWYSRPTLQNSILRPESSLPMVSDCKKA